MSGRFKVEPREFECWIPNWNESTPSKIRAYGAEDAAETFAEQCHDGQREYPDHTIVNVTDENGAKTKWTVTWEAVRNYYAEAFE